MSTTTTNTVPGGAVEQSTREAAQRRLTAIRGSLVHSDALLVEAWRARDWKALGHATWREYVAERIPELHAIAVRAEVRDPRILELAREGMSQRAIAEALGIGVGTVNRALEGVDLGETVTASDGRTMPARVARTPRRKKKRTVPLTDQIVALLHASGPLDVLAITKELRGVDRSMVSPALTRLQQTGRIAHLAPAKRGQFGTWTATTS